MASVFRTPAFLYTGLKNFTRHGFENAIRETSPAHVALMADPTSLASRVCLVTGANQGLVRPWFFLVLMNGFQARPHTTRCTPPSFLQGLEIATQLAKRQGTVYLCCRNEQRGKDAVSKVKEVSKNDDVHLVVCDVSSLQDVRRFVQDWKQSKRPLNVLVHNAGVLIHHDDTSNKQKSVDGHEINFATNTLGVYALTQGLEPVLRQSGTPAFNSRVIIVSSGGAYTSGLEVDDLEGDSLAKDGSAYYARDKRRQIALAEYFDKRWRDGGDNVTAVSMHPGWADTEGVRTSIPSFHKTFRDKLRTVEQGADTVVFLSVVPKLEGGAFYLDRRVQKKHLPLSFTGYSKEQVARLVEKLDALVG
jgi:dehydrogenase/reductase SDR family protein 12